MQQPFTLFFLSVSLQCYLFHMYVGVRAGGGIGDELEDPAGDPYELYRILFDITFFFFVIVILLAIIQGTSARWASHLYPVLPTVQYVTATRVYRNFALQEPTGIIRATHTFCAALYSQGSLLRPLVEPFSNICSRRVIRSVPLMDWHLPSGLIIDAFGELRDQQEQVKEDMEVRRVLGQDLSV